MEAGNSKSIDVKVIPRNPPGTTVIENVKVIPRDPPGTVLIKNVEVISTSSVRNEVPKKPTTVHEGKSSGLVSYKRDRRIIPVKELFKIEAQEQEFLWGTFIPAGSISLLSGPSDCGKTMLARQLCIAIAKGDEQLLSLPLNPKYKKAIYVSTEDSKSDWVFKMNKIQLTEEDKEKIGENMLVVTEYDSLVQILESELKHNAVDLIVIDVLPDVCTGDLNSTAVIRAFLKPYKKLTTDYGCSIVFIHHLSKKGESSGSPNKQNILGAMGIEGSMRSVLELRKDPSDGSIKQISITKGNYVSEVDKKKVHRIKQGDHFMYEAVGLIIPPINTVKEDLKEAIKKWMSQGLSGRAITEELIREGHKVGKTTVAEVIAKIKAENTQETDTKTTQDDED